MEWSTIQPLGIETGLVCEMLKVMEKVEGPMWWRAKHSANLGDFLSPRGVAVVPCTGLVYILSLIQALSSE